MKSKQIAQKLATAETKRAELAAEIERAQATLNKTAAAVLSGAASSGDHIASANSAVLAERALPPVDALIKQLRDDLKAAQADERREAHLAQLAQISKEGQDALDTFQSERSALAELMTERLTRMGEARKRMVTARKSWIAAANAITHDSLHLLLSPANSSEAHEKMEAALRELLGVLEQRCDLTAVLIEGLSGRTIADRAIKLADVGPVADALDEAESIFDGRRAQYNRREVERASAARSQPAGL